MDKYFVAKRMDLPRGFLIERNDAGAKELTHSEVMRELLNNGIENVIVLKKVEVSGNHVENGASSFWIADPEKQTVEVAEITIKNKLYLPKGEQDAKSEGE